MDVRRESEATPTKNRTGVERKSERELVVTEKVGRVRTCRIGARRLEEVEAWIERYHRLWDERFGELDQVLEELKRKEKTDGRKKNE